MLEEFIGSWAGTETMFDSPWSAAGTTQGDFSFSQSLPGLWLRDYRQRRPGGEFHAHEVYQQQADGEIWLFGFDSFGFPPLEPARGKFDGGSLSLVKTTPRGRARHRWTPSDPAGGIAELHYQVDISVLDSTDFLPFLRADYQRADYQAPATSAPGPAPEPKGSP